MKQRSDQTLDILERCMKHNFVENKGKKIYKLMKEEGNIPKSNFYHCFQDSKWIWGWDQINKENPEQKTKIWINDTLQKQMIKSIAALPT